MTAATRRSGLRRLPRIRACVLAIVRLHLPGVTTKLAVGGVRPRSPSLHHSALVRHNAAGQRRKKGQAHQRT